MKKNYYYFALTAWIMIAISSCKEEPPYIDYSVPQYSFDTTYIVSPPPAQSKEVLIEDQSGTMCPNCPAAAIIGNGIVAANPAGRVNIYTLYPNLNGNPLVFPVSRDGVYSKYDMRTDIGLDIVNFLTVPPSLPAGYIDRKVFASNPNSDWFIPKENWTSDVSSELSLSTPLNIDLVSNYIYPSRKLTLDVTVTLNAAFTPADTGKKYIHVMLLQDSIIDAQANNDAGGAEYFDSVYTHRHVLMDMLTSHIGDLLNDSPDKTLIPGRAFRIRYEKVLENPRVRTISTVPASSLPPPQWNPGHMIALVFVTDGTTKNVLQSHEIDIAP
jgi:hypothetical protein